MAASSNAMDRRSTSFSSRRNGAEVHDWTHTKISKRRHLRERKFKLIGMFREMYPDVAVPGVDDKDA